MDGAMTFEDNAQFIIHTIKSKIHRESTHCRLISYILDLMVCIMNCALSSEVMYACI